MDNKKGITPVLSIVLLLMMTIGVFAITYSWITDKSSDIQTNTDKNLKNTESKMRAEIKIQSIYECDSHVCISVQNTGTYEYADVCSTATPVLFIDNHPVSVYNLYYVGTTTCAHPFSPGDNIIINSTKPFDDLRDGDVHKIKVSMPNGISDIDTCYVQGTDDYCD